MKISENTSVSMPMKNLISIVISVAIGVWAYFGIVEKLNGLLWINIKDDNIKNEIHFSSIYVQYVK